MNTVQKVFSVVGVSVPRVDGLEKVTGGAKYVADLAIPGMIEGNFCAARTRMRASARSILLKPKRCRV